jgi:putative heme-binding domain-containing protein
LTANSPAGQLLEELLREASRTATDDTASAEARAQALLLLAHAEFSRARPVFAALLGVRQPQGIQLAAVRGLRNTAAPEVPVLLLEGWRGWTPAVRAEVVATLSARPAWAAALLDAVSSGQVPAAHIDPTRRALLLKHRDPKVRARAAELLGEAARTPRSEVVARYQVALEKRGDAARGQKVFKRECMSCHLDGSLGHNVGPSIAAIGTRTPEALLIAILDPNREVDPRYLGYTLATTDGRAWSGIILAETATSISLRRADGVTDTILRSQIEALASTGQSLMPEGLEQKIDTHEMADLLAFLLEPP